MSTLIQRLYEFQERQLEQEECISCGQMHDPLPQFYLGRYRYACSERCWDDWLQWGRWER